MKRPILAGLFLLTMLSLCGCGLYPKETKETPDISDVIIKDSFVDQLTHVETPKEVIPMEKPDKTLYNPFFFVSTRGIRSAGVLSQSSFFTYTPMKRDWKDLYNITQGSNISVRRYRDLEQTNVANYTSGFIYKIDNNYLYIATAGHCIDKDSLLEKSVITFCDRETVWADMRDYEILGRHQSTDGDVAMYRVPVNIVPYDTLLRLKEVCFSKEAIEKLKAGDVLGTGNINATKWSQDFEKQVTVLSEDSSEAIWAKNSFPYLKSGNYILTNAGLKGGQSGSAMFDENGYVVGICSGHCYQGNLHYAGIFAKATHLDELYDRIREEENEKEGN